MGVTLLLLSSFLLAMGAYWGKVVLNMSNMSGAINAFSRFFLSTIIMFIYIVVTKKSFKAKNMKPIVWRAVFNSVAILLFSKAVEYTTITNGNMLHMTYPVFVILFAPLFTKEKFDKKVYLYLLMVIIGGYIVTNPSFEGINKGDILAALSSVLAGISILNLTLSRRENDGYIIVFYVMLIGSFINLPFAWNDIVNFEWNSVIYVVLGGLGGLAGQLLLTAGYKYVDSATGSLLSSSRIIMSALIGYFLLSEPLNLRIILGMLLITLALVGASGFFDSKRLLRKE